MAAWNVAPDLAAHGSNVGLSVFFAAAPLSRLANGDFGGNAVDATRRVGNVDRAKASAAGVGRVTAVGGSMPALQAQIQAG